MDEEIKGATENRLSGGLGTGNSLYVRQPTVSVDEKLTTFFRGDCDCAKNQPMSETPRLIVHRQTGALEVKKFMMGSTKPFGTCFAQEG